MPCPFDAIRCLMNALGSTAEKQLLFTTKTIDADTALCFCRVQYVVAEEDLSERVDVLAGQIARVAPLSIRAIKFSPLDSCIPTRPNGIWHSAIRCWPLI